MRRFLVLALTGVFLCSCATTRSTWPGHLESHHHIRLQNGYVRVLETRLEPGEETLAHSHPIDAVVIFLTDGRFRVEQDNGAVDESEVRADQVVWGAAGGVHRTANIGDRTTRTLAIEIFAQPPGGEKAQESLQDARIALENDRVRVAVLEAVPDESTGFETSSPGVAVAMSTTRVESAGKTRRLQRGDVCWITPGNHSIHAGSDGSSTIYMITLMPAR